MSGRHTHYIAIDFGTSGCAFAIGLGNPEPKDIEVFSGWSETRMGVRLKCPTILLANPQGTFESFGDKALDDYKRLKNKATGYYLFERFKMKLYENPNSKMIEAANGKSLPAVDVFAMALKFIKDKALEQINKEDISCLPNKRIQWIITIPTIWTDVAKDVMRKAAKKINLEKESVVFAYEPEAAALFTQYDFLHSEEHITQFSYLVVDCGGGTVDIATHKITKQHGNIFVENLISPHGNNYGGFAVNDQFEKLINNILKVSAEKFKQLKINCAVQWTLLINRIFEENKITMDPSHKFMPIFMSIPSKICGEIKIITGKSLEELIDDYNDESVEWYEAESSIVLNPSAIDKLFSPVLDEICKLIRTVLAKQECKEIETILLVGGFACSPHLFNRIEQTFGKDYKVRRSSTPTFSVVKGAVLCGQQENLIKPLLENMEGLSTAMECQLEIQSDASQQYSSARSESRAAIVTHASRTQTLQLESSMQIVKHLPPATTKHLPFVLSRKMGHTIGVETVEEFQNGYHDIKKLTVIDKEQYCDRIFHILVKVNESVFVGSPKRVYTFHPASDKQAMCVLNIFASSKENVRYTDEEDCRHRTKVEISGLPECDTKLSRDIELHVNFFNTEVEITAFCVTDSKNKVRVTVDYQFT